MEHGSIAKHLKYKEVILLLHLTPNLRINKILWIPILLLLTLCLASCGGGGKTGSPSDPPTPPPPGTHDPTKSPFPAATAPSGQYPFIDFLVSLPAGAEKLWQSIGVDGSGIEQWSQIPSPQNIRSAGVYRFKTTTPGLTDSEILQLQYSSYQWRTVGTGTTVSNTVVSSLSITLTDMGDLYLAYCYNGDIYVKRYSGFHWDNVGSPFPGRECVIASDFNAIYLATTDLTSTICVKKLNGSSWENIGGAVGTASSSANLGRQSFCFDASNGSLFILYLSAIDNRNTLKKLSGSTWISLDATFSEYYYFAMQAVNGDPYVIMGNRGGSLRVMTYQSGWINLVNPGVLPLLNCTIDGINADRRGNNNFSLDIAVNEQTMAVYFIGDYVRNGYDDYFIGEIRNGQLRDITTHGSDDPDDLRVGVFQDKAVIAYENHDNFVGYDPAGINFEYVMDNPGIPLETNSLNHLESGSSYVDGAKYIALAATHDYLYVAFSDLRNGGRITVYAYQP